MRALAVIAFGVIAGGAGALVANRLASSQPPAPEPRPEATAARMVVPPGWNPQYLARLDAVERKVASLDTRTVEPAHPIDSPRERERATRYEQELAEQAGAIAAHDRETHDAAWATPLERSLATKLEAAAPASRGVAVECRSKTCLVHVHYPSPAEAIENRASFPVVAGCKGVTSTPTPPADAGPYDLVAIYDCG